MADQIFVYEVWRSIDLFFDKFVDLPDGWYFNGDLTGMRGPYADVDAALDAAANAASAETELHLIDMRGSVTAPRAN
jgi:hypothetical protein